MSQYREIWHCLSCDYKADSLYIHPDSFTDTIFRHEYSTRHRMKLVEDYNE